MEFSVIKEICQECWLTQPDLSDYTGIKYQRIKDISAGRVEGFKSDEIGVLVEKLHLNVAWLTTGGGEVFKDGFSRSYPSKSDFVAGVLNRLVKLTAPVIYEPDLDEVLDLKKGSASAWIKKGQIPYWYLKGFASRHGVSIDHLIYGLTSHDVKYTTHRQNALISGSGKDVSLKANEKSYMTMHMATSVSTEVSTTGNEVDASILSACLQACSTVYGDDFNGSSSRVQIEYAVDLYNLLVRLSEAMGDSLDKMRRLESDGFAQQLELFIRLRKVKQFPPAKEMYMF